MTAATSSLSDLVIERVGFGLFVLDRAMNVLMWNRFMQDHGIPAADVIGRNLFDCFPDLPRAWLSRKLERVPARQLRVQLVGAAALPVPLRARPADHGWRRLHAAGLHVHAAHARPRRRSRVRDDLGRHACERDAARARGSGREAARARESRRPDRHREPALLRGAAQRRMRAGSAMAATCRCCCSTSTTSRRSTTASGMRPAMPCCARRRVASRRSCARRIRSAASAAKFALLLPCTNLDEAMLVADKVRDAIGSVPVDAEGSACR